MSLRELEHAPRGSSIRKLSDIAESLSDSADPDIVWCKYCNKPFRLTQYANHKCRGRRLKNLYGEKQTLAILNGERNTR